MGAKFKIPTEEDLKDYFDPKWIHYTASVIPPRPGFALFSTTLEHQFYEPGTPKNADFRIMSTAWLHGSMWMTVTIPYAEKHLAEAVAQYCGLKILDTFPISSKKFPMFATVREESLAEIRKELPDTEPFPLHNCVNHFSLENSDDHPIKSKTMTMEEWNKHEHEMVGKIIGEHEWTEDDEEELKKFRDYMEGVTKEL